MLLTSILLVPLIVGLVCPFIWLRALVEWLNLAGFVAGLLLGVRLLGTVLSADGGAVSEWREFLRADALSAWMVLLISVVSLVSSLYAVGYFRRELAGAEVNERR